MNRRSFLKQVAATAAVGAVAPKLLAQTPDHCVNMAMDPAAMAGASRVVVNGARYEIALDIENWKWVWVPLKGVRTAGAIAVSLEELDVNRTQGKAIQLNDEWMSWLEGEITVDNKDGLGQDKDVMNRANSGSFTPAAHNPQGTPV